jgi:hypothetical protein
MARVSFYFKKIYIYVALGTCTVQHVNVISVLYTVQYAVEYSTEENTVFVKRDLTYN